VTFYTYGELAAAHPTGRRRYRRGRFGKMILQIEIKHPHTNYPSAPRPGPYDPWRNGSFTFWRDATQFDVARIESAQLSPPASDEAVA
jgi:hypothetical protein